MSEVTLYNADCLQMLPGLVGVDAVVTDPPYGINYKTGHLPKTMPDDTYSTSGRGDIAGDNDTAARDWVAAWAAENKLPCAMFGTWKVERPKQTRAVLIWNKGPAFGMGDLSFPWKPSFEEIYIMGEGWEGRRDEGILSFSSVSRISMGRAHPNMKPVSLMKHLIQKLPKALTILDPFMGSGTTGVACVQTGRNFIGIEIDPGYFAIAEKRIKQAQLQMRMDI
jgi:DNA modification methylase